MFSSVALLQPSRASQLEEIDASLRERLADMRELCHRSEKQLLQISRLYFVYLGIGRFVLTYLYTVGFTVRQSIEVILSHIYRYRLPE